MSRSGGAMSTRELSAPGRASGRVGHLRGLAAPVAIASLLVLSGPPGRPGDSAQAQTGGTFKIAFWNIASGIGAQDLPGRTCSFVRTGNCTNPSLPLNAWGMHVVQDELVQRIRNDGAVVALGLAEAWSCATPAAVQQVLGWKARSTARSGIALIARFGFGGPEEWIQLDTSGTTNPADTKFVLRVPVCLDQACTRSIVVYSTHLFAASDTEAIEYNKYATQVGQVLDFAAARSGTEPHVMIGDFNIFEGTSIVCAQKPKNAGIRMLRAAGYLDAWSAVHGTEDGSTGMWNRSGCGVPEGNLWKRLDFGWTKRVNPLTVTRFGMVVPGQCAPSDHAGILMEYAIEDPAVASPTVTVTAPSQNATVTGLVWLSAQVADGIGIRRLEWLLDGRVIGVQTSSPFLFEWDAKQVANGPHVLQAAATNVAGRRAVSASRAIRVSNPVGPNDEIVLYAADATVAGTQWNLVTDSTAAAGARLQNTNGAATASAPATQPSSYAELNFIANAGTGYRLWIRGKAIDNAPENDAVFVQFNDAVDAAGAAKFRIGTQSATTVNIEDCQGCSLSGWGWQDNESGRDVLGPLVYFPTTGAHRLRLQARQDGLGLDQIVLSAVTYRFGAPGALLNDTTILEPPGGQANLPPVVQLTAPAAGTTVTASATLSLAATASDPDDAVAYVEFYRNSTLIADDTSPPYMATWTTSTPGSYTLTARATDTRGTTTTSSGRTVTGTAAGLGRD